MSVEAAIDLFSDLDRYPQRPGWKARSTARAAADSVAPKAPRLRQMCLDTLRTSGPLTADEIAARLGIDRLSIRPRLSELSSLGQAKDSGVRRSNASGKSAVAWEATQ
jgi:predicted ArsR family transcriptional regulator